ncbi:LytR/AlgR family response regulator transcription factor [Polaribacter sp. L3A8]|uniref:LytR/AlgR family response regulator transcription factor n=1 Tax=Polaribacter sp. L3A8 TaxID=2686361 RepID=UPI00131E3BD5|nr:LytTR family DNA-binding domain-containing protein [Polaribacter sp. L3A8]
MKYTYIIIQDKKEALDDLRSALDEHSDYKFVDTATNLEDGFSLILKTKPNLIFLDVEINDRNTFTLIPKLKEFFTDLPIIIMTTTHNYYAKEAVNNQVSYFLSKPIQPVELENSLLFFEKTFTERQTHLVVKTGADIYLLNYNKISFLQAERNYTSIFNANGKSFSTSKSLKHFEETLPKKFIRVHRSFIVNKNCIERLNTRKGQLFLQPTDTLQDLEENFIPIGKEYLQKLKNSFSF